MAEAEGQKAFDPNEFELRPPKEMMNDMECLLCAIVFANSQQRKAHYNSIKHQMKETQWVKDTYAQMGIKTDRFLWNPKKLAGKIPSYKREARELEMDPNRGLRDDQLPPGFPKTFGCPQCRLWFEGPDIRKEHHKSGQHALVVWEIKMRHVRRDNSSISATAHKFNDFTCIACDKTLTNPYSWESHMYSRQHIMTCKRIAETGSPAHAPKERVVNEKKEEKRKRRAELMSRAVEVQAGHTASTLLTLSNTGGGNFFTNRQYKMPPLESVEQQQVQGGGVVFGFGSGFRAGDEVDEDEEEGPSTSKSAKPVNTGMSFAEDNFDFVNDV